MSLPYTNATLTAITSVGTTGDYDTPAAPGANRWAGELPVTVVEKIVEAISPGRVDELKQTRVEIPYDTGQLVRRGDTLTFTYEDASHQRRAGTILHARLVGRVRIILEEG